MGRYQVILVPVLLLTNAHAQDDIKTTNPEISFNHPECQVNFSQFSKLIALNSFPGSGNTWLRSLIEKSFGYYTGSVYMDRKLYDGGFLGEFSQPFSGRTIMQKIHHNRRDKLTSSYYTHTENCVTLMRKPKEAFLAEFKRTHAKKASNKSGLNTHVQDIEVDPKKFAKFFRSKFKSYVADSLLFLNKCRNNHVLFFEDLKSDAVAEMVRMEQFLNDLYQESKFSVREECLAVNLDGDFHRVSGKSDEDKYKVYQHVDWLDKKKFNALVKEELAPVFEAQVGQPFPPEYYLEV